MTKDKVFVSRRQALPAIDLLKQHFEVEVWDDTSPPPKSVFLQKGKECQAFLTAMDDMIDKEVLEAATRLRIVSNRAMGYDNIDIGEATRLGIVVGNTPGVLHESCADFTFALILAIARNVVFGDQEVRAGAWKGVGQMPHLSVDMEVYGATLGIVGLGNIGLAVARRAKAFDMRLLYFSRTRKPHEEDRYGLEWMPDLPSLLRESDFVSIHVPLAPETDHLIGQRELRLMKQGSFLINTSRGGTVDSKALYDALSNKIIAGAALDVTDPEPISQDDPLVSLSNVVITPHIASDTSVTLRKIDLMAAENIIEFLNGRPMPSWVNPEAKEARPGR